MTLPELSERTLDFGREVTRALLGVDVLYRSESGDETGLAVLNMDREGTFAPEAFVGYSEAARRWRSLKAEAESLPEPDRATYYRQLADATLAFITWRQEGLPFEAQLASFLQMPAEPVSEERLDRMRAEMHTLLGEMGYHGPLARRAAAWEERTRVPAEAVEEVCRDLMREAWRLTNERVVEIPADESDGMTVVAVTEVPFNARCNYLIRKVELNVEPTLTLPGLRHLAVHEGYPGHYVQFKLRETLYREGAAPADNLLSVVNTASSSVFEGIADTGLEMIGWDRSPDDRFQGLMNRYRCAIGTGAAWRLHALGWSREAATDWLRDQALTGGEGWVLNRMGFIDAPSRAVLIWSYWWGEPVVSEAWHAAVADGRKAEFVRYLYGRMHSNRTVEMFHA
jgi:hypothetical protein